MHVGLWRLRIGKQARRTNLALRHTKYDVWGYVLDTSSLCSVVGVWSEPSRRAGRVIHIFLPSSLREHDTPRQFLPPALFSGKTAANGKKMALPS